MRTFAADCLSTPLTSQMVGWTWTRSESESWSLLCHTGGASGSSSFVCHPLCLTYICAASVSHPGSSPAAMTASDVSPLPYVSVYYCNFPSHQTRPCLYTFPLRSQQAAGFIESSNHTLHQQTCERLSVPQSHKCTHST